MTIAFDLNKLSGIYIETMKSPEKAVAFDFKYANGEFLFMIFLSDEDEKSKDKLFVYMRNTRRLLELKMYGNHFKDKFLIYFKDRDQQAFLDELNLNVNDGNSFKFEDFLECLNANIPKTISRKERKHNLRDNCRIINRISDDEKTVFIGPRKLSVGHTDADVEKIDQLIEYLLSINTTVAWTTEDQLYQAIDINTYLQQVL